MSNLLSKAKIKHINALKLKKFRQKYNNFIAEGDKIAKEILLNHASLVIDVFATTDWIAENQYLLNPFNSQLTPVSVAELKKISNLKTPNKVLIVLKQPEKQVSKPHKNENWILVLDGIQDPGNMGTIIRTADWFGITQLICSPNCVDIYNTKVIQSSMGSFLRIGVEVTDLEVLFRKYNDTPVYGAVMNGKNLHETNFSKKGFILMGNEGKGISNSLLPLIQHKITIPRYGKAESLNVGIATGIILGSIKIQ